MPEGDELSEHQIEAAIWYVKHRAFLRKVLVGGLLAFDIGLLGFVLFGAGRDLVSLPLRNAQDTELLGINFAQTLAHPADLQLGGVELLQNGQVSDVVTRVRNPNAQWYVLFSYTIGVGEHVEKLEDGFLLPGQERPIFRSFRGLSSNGAVVFNLEHISWRRINPRDIPDVETFKQEHLNFEIKNPQFFPSVIQGQGNLDRVKFTAVNKSAYSYAEPKFLVLLYRGSRLIGIQSTVLERFTSGQSRQVELSWIDHIGAVSNVEVQPEIDIFDPEVYMK